MIHCTGYLTHPYVWGGSRWIPSYPDHEYEGISNSFNDNFMS